MTATQVARTFEVTPLLRWFSQGRFASGSSPGHYPCDGCSYTYSARAPDTPYLAALQQPIRLAEYCANLCPSLSSVKETGTSTTAAALIAHGFAAFPLVTIGVTNADVTSNSHVDDGAADQGMDCT